MLQRLRENDPGLHGADLLARLQVRSVVEEVALEARNRTREASRPPSREERYSDLPDSVAADTSASPVTPSLPVSRPIRTASIPSRITTAAEPTAPSTTATLTPR